MERQEIETFLVLCEELHFGRTAKRLRISPARVTQLVQKVERRIGATLFERNTRGVTLTDLGRRFQRDLAPAHEAVEEIVLRTIQAAKGIEGELRLGFLGTANGRHLVELARLFEAHRPGATVRLVLEAEIGDHLRPLREDRVDLLAVPLPVREQGIALGPVVLRERLLMAVPEGHPIAIRGHATFEDLADNPVIVSSGDPDDYWIDYFVPPRTPSGRPIERTHRVESLQAGIALVMAGKGIGPIIAQFAQYNQHPGITYVPIENGPVVASALAWSAARETALIRDFARLAEDHGPVAVDWPPATA
ncbi:MULTISPECIES: LysR family transcriptional regulator [Glycomyces]|uniref:DNA-binding transcriptional LysR family regulator n=2 Tax=Glycomyces TaxID=58113 RepID=A0A9X3PDT3_9ACTN|nr:LysR family transcriptional regulator [Glycomyces lechevalierae]MDA1383754.1 LysR family transcriptional regulator [Glycomyces lechevalierae]MDR7341255.1 DNA-binding transcriptional LysR family regulator [Glycomyces lechevalierae]